MLAKYLMAGVRRDTQHVGALAEIATGMEQEQAQWIADLRAQGVKAAHPDDGWVNREQNQLHFCYPQFNDGAAIGDVVALGWPKWSDNISRTRLVRITRRVVSTFGIEWWKFEPVIDR